ncbi:nicotinamide mononucleotide transporter family protein [Catenulispora yoronensis]|uniref:Nicotinamide mononucleotide transporter family protein n=1 Tax=Catenulispora yoronensis TaxID=450799 RepID=A0ABP5GWT1_9ACTN
MFHWANAVAFHLFGETVKWSDLLGNLLGLLTVALATRRSMWAWPVQIAGCVLLFGAFVSAHLGGTAARQVALIGMAAYGWARWNAVRRNEHDIAIRWASWAERALLVAALGVGTAVFAQVLQHYNASWSPWPDAYIFIGSLVATVAQARGYVEFWFVWVAVDVVGVPLAFSNGLPVSGLVYVFYFLIVVAGLRQWMARARAPREGAPSAQPAVLKEVTV